MSLNSIDLLGGVVAWVNSYIVGFKAIPKVLKDLEKIPALLADLS